MSHAFTPRVRALVITIVVLAFIAGASAGVAGDRLVAPGGTHRIAVISDMSRVLDRLELTAAQRRDAEAIVQRSAPRTHAIMLEVRDRLRAVADSVDLELRAILTPEQRVRLDSLRRHSRLVLRRKVTTPAGTVVDTIIDARGGEPRP